MEISAPRKVAPSLRTIELLAEFLPRPRVPSTCHTVPVPADDDLIETELVAASLADAEPHARIADNRRTRAQYRAIRNNESAAVSVAAQYECVRIVPACARIANQNRVVR